MDSIKLDPPADNFGLTNLTDADYARLQEELDAITDAERQALRDVRDSTF